MRAATDTYGKQLYGEAMSEADARIVDRVEEVAKETGIPPAQMALAWLLQKPGVVAPIIGVSKPGQLDDALAAMQMQLPGEVTASLEEGYLPQSVAGI